MTPAAQLPLAHLSTHAFQGPFAYRREKAGKTAFVAVCCLSRSKTVAQEIKCYVRPIACPIPLFTEYDLGLVRVKLQLTFLKSLANLLSEKLRFSEAVGMDDNIVSVPFKHFPRKSPTHPEIKGVVQEQVSQ